MSGYEQNQKTESSKIRACIYNLSQSIGSHKEAIFMLTLWQPKHYILSAWPRSEQIVISVLASKLIIPQALIQYLTLEKASSIIEDKMQSKKLNKSHRRTIKLLMLLFRPTGNILVAFCKCQNIWNICQHISSVFLFKALSISVNHSMFAQDDIYAWHSVCVVEHSLCCWPEQPHTLFTDCPLSAGQTLCLWKHTEELIRSDISVCSRWASVIKPDLHREPSRDKPFGSVFCEFIQLKLSTLFIYKSRIKKNKRQSGMTMDSHEQPNQKYYQSSLMVTIQIQSVQMQWMISIYVDDEHDFINVHSDLLDMMSDLYGNLTVYNQCPFSLIKIQIR